MSYCNASQIRGITDTDLSDPELDELAAEVSALMRLRLSTGAIDPSILTGICKVWSSLKCYLKDPTTEGMGEYSASKDKQMEMLRAELRDLIRIAGGGVSLRYESEQLPRW